MKEFFLAGGPVMYPLLACSLVAIAVILERALFWVQIGRACCPDAVDRVLAADWQPDEAELKRLRRDPIGRVLLAGRAAPADEGVWRMQVAAGTELRRMGRYLGTLNTMVALAPLLGIFGTVLGIIQSFELMGGASLADPATASRGLAQALITTAFGLAIAMPSLVAFRFFHGKALRYQQRMDECCTGLELRRAEFRRDALRMDAPELREA